MLTHVLYRFFSLASIFLILLASLAGSHPISIRCFNDLKHLMMFFNEPLLSGASVDGFTFDDGTTSASFEGAYRYDVADKIIESIKNAALISETAKEFNVWFSSGTEFGKSIPNSWSNDADMKEQAKKLQKNILEKLEQNQRIVIPFGWAGTNPHAIGLCIEKIPTSNTYNLIVINTSGSSYHRYLPDPNNVYPHLARLWIEFKNIPHSELFSDNYWFMYPMMIFKNDGILKEMEPATGSIENYFYGSILSNFKNYLSPLDKSTKKLVPHQRSGSCTLSSMMAAYLYYAKDEVEFHKDKVIIGHYMLDRFLTKYFLDAKIDESFKALITDGFDLIPRKLIRSTKSALAHQILLFLEYRFPEAFKHAGLIGAERSVWIKQKKDKAIKELKANDKTPLILIQATIKLALHLEKLLKENPINVETTRIEISPNTRSINPNVSFETFNYPKYSLEKTSNIYWQLNERIERLPLQISDLDALSTKLEKCKNLDNIKAFTCVQDSFESVSKKNWWNWLDENTSTAKALGFLELCTALSRKYLSSSSTPNSLDDIVMQAHLQLGAWKSAIIYDNTILTTKKTYRHLGLSNFKPPLVLQTIINSSLTSGEMSDWRIITTFDKNNLSKLNYLLESYQGLSSGSEHFFGPSNFLLENSFNCDVKNTYDQILSSPLNSKLYETIWGQIESKITSKRDELRIQHKNEEWVSKDHAKLRVFLSMLDEFEKSFPHYTKLMKFMFFTHIRAGKCPKYDYPKCTLFEACNGNLNSVSLNNRSDKWEYMNNFKLSSKNCQFDLNAQIKSCRAFKGSSSREETLFFRLRHSQAFSNPTTFLNFEAWLNYIKGAQDSYIFNEPYFLYLTDRILNMPILTLDNNGYIELDVKKHYVQDFGKRHIYSVFTEMMRIINFDLNVLIEKKGQLSSKSKSFHVKTSVNVAISLVRFLERIDNDDISSGATIAKMLAEVYMAFFKFCHFKGLYALEEQHISAINLVLTKICDIPLRNNKTFLSEIEIGVRKDEKKNISRVSLARMHWFMTRMHYAVFAIGKSLSDDVFNRGFVFHPVSSEKESLGMSSLLRIIFLDDTEMKSTIEYSTNGDIARAKLADNNSTVIAIQLSSGKFFKNGSLQVEKNVVMNHASFTNFFVTEEDRMFASQGEISKIDKYIVFLISNFKFKGNSIVFIITGQDCKIFIKSEEKWYMWNPSKNEMVKKLKYNWSNGYHMFVRSEGNGNEAETIFKKIEEASPIIKFTHKRKCPETIIMGEFCNNSIWILLNYDPKAHTDLSKHLKYFTDTDTIIAKEKNLETIVIIYPGLRIQGSDQYPVVISELTDTESQAYGSKFKILNTELYLEDHQIVSNNASISGTLIAKNNDGQRFILAPVSELGSKTDYLTTKYIEMIPVVDGFPAPQTRLQRLLLAYYCLRSREFGLSREFLQPYTSVNQNEPFSILELNVIYWISSLKSGGPESFSLQVMASLHSLINSRKFPQDYHPDKDSMSSEDWKIIKLKSEILNNISKNLSLNFYAYSMSIRELSEKYYVHRIFPEILDYDIFKLLCIQFSAPSQIQDSSSSEKIEYLTEGKDENLLLVFKAIPKELIYNIINMKYQRKDMTDFLDIMAKLIIRQNYSGNLRSSDGSMVFYCARSNPNLLFSRSLMDVFEKYTKGHNHPSDWDPKHMVNYELSDVVKVLKENIEACKTMYSSDFTPTKLPDKSNDTDYMSIRKTLLTDAKLIETDSSTFVSKIDVCSIQDIQSFNILSNKLVSVLPLNHESVDVDFRESSLRNSTVLAKLKGSIESFVTEYGQYDKLELKFNDALKDDFIEFIFYLEARIKMTKGVIDCACDTLFKISGYDSKAEEASEAYSVELLTRNFHQKKQKHFENLYSCYQRNSIKCIQHKFPQLSYAESETLLADIVFFYSNNIFLDYLTLISQKIEQIKTIFNQDSDIEVDEISLLIDEMKKISDFNIRLAKPSILNFEYKSKKYRLRTEQANDIDHLSSIDPVTNLFKSTVIQRMMAAGKTLVLGTISVVQKAMDSTKLSILVPPTSLYQSNLSSMQSRTYSYFKTKGLNFIFPRFKYSCSKDLTDVIIPFLNSLIKQMNHVMNSKDYLVLSPDSLQAFLNSYIEMLNLYAHPENLTDLIYMQSALTLYAQIHQVFKNKSSIILDEIDMTMDPKKELNFPTVENEPLNMYAATLTTDLMEFSLFDHESNRLGLDILGNNQSSLTEAGFEKYRVILMNYIKKQLDDEKSIWTDYLIDKTVKILTPLNIMRFLENEDISFMKDWILKLHEAQKTTIADCLVIIKVQIWKNLKESLKSSANLNYGATGTTRPTTEYAIPYLAANTPSPSSEFADRWETLNKTLLMLASVPCSKSIAKNMINYLRKGIIEETSLDVKLEQTATYKNVQVLMPGVDILNFEAKIESNVNVMHSALSKRSPAAIRLLFSYALDEIFSKMKFSVDQITSNALNMASLFGSVQGYSGTIDNVNILPREVVCGAFENHMVNEKNNGGIALKLITDSKSHSSNHVLQLSDDILKEPAQKILRHMIKNSLNEKEITELSAVIDVGAFFKNFKNREISIGILTIMKRIETVLYYDEESNQVEFIKRTSQPHQTKLLYTVGYLSSTDPESILKATQSDISKRFTFYDQRHITGSDILQPKSARALLTIGTRVLLRDILQGTLRMRQFMTSQNVHLVTSCSAAQFYFSKLEPLKDTYAPQTVLVSDMISLGAFNEDEKQATENEKLAFTKIESEVRKFVLERITEDILNAGANRNMIKRWFSKSKNSEKQVRDLFIRRIKESPIQWMNSPVLKSSQVVLSEYSSYWIDKLEILSKEFKFMDDTFGFSESPEFLAFKHTLKVMTTPANDKKYAKDSLLEFAKGHIFERNYGQNDSSQVEMQAFTQQLVELDLDKLMQTIPASLPPLAKRSKFEIGPFVLAAKDPIIDTVDSKGILSLESVLNDPEMSPIQSKMALSACLTDGKRVAISSDLIKIIDFSPERPFKIFSNYTWEGSHILVQVLPDRAGIRAVLLSTESANEVLSDKDSIMSKTSTFWMCDLSGTISATSDLFSAPGDNILDLIPKSRILLFDLLIFNGSLDIILSSKHLKRIYLNFWLKSPNYQLRARFLLLRMKVLAEKANFAFGPGNKQITILNRAARGDKDILSNLKMSSGAFKKLPITQAMESTFSSINLVTELKTQVKDDIPTIFRQISGIDDLNSKNSDDNGFDNKIFKDDIEILEIDRDDRDNEFSTVKAVSLSDYWHEIAAYDEPAERDYSDFENASLFIDWNSMSISFSLNLWYNVDLIFYSIIILMIIAFMLFRRYKARSDIGEQEHDIIAHEPYINNSESELDEPLSSV
jgi:hypothetical protein